MRLIFHNGNFPILVERYKKVITHEKLKTVKVLHKRAYDNDDTKKNLKTFTSFNLNHVEFKWFYWNFVHISNMNYRRSINHLLSPICSFPNNLQRKGKPKRIPKKTSREFEDGMNQPMEKMKGIVLCCEE